MKEISFNRFKKETHHKKVKYKWKNPLKVREWEVQKFYINKDKRYGFCTPKFILGLENEFFKIDDTHFKAVSKNGFTTFEVL